MFSFFPSSSIDMENRRIWTKNSNNSEHMDMMIPNQNFMIIAGQFDFPTVLPISVGSNALLVLIEILILIQLTFFFFLLNLILSILKFGTHTMYKCFFLCLCVWLDKILITDSKAFQDDVYWMKFFLLPEHFISIDIKAQLHLKKLFTLRRRIYEWKLCRLNDVAQFYDQFQ